MPVMKGEMSDYLTDEKRIEYMKMLGEVMFCRKSENDGGPAPAKREEELGPAPLFEVERG